MSGAVPVICTQLSSQKIAISAKRGFSPPVLILSIFMCSIEISFTHLILQQAAEKPHVNLMVKKGAYSRRATCWDPWWSVSFSL